MLLSPTAAPAAAKTNVDLCTHNLGLFIISTLSTDFCFTDIFDHNTAFMQDLEDNKSAFNSVKNYQNINVIHNYTISWR